MNKKIITKRSLALSVLSLLVCVSMLIGTTFAWFTDNVTSGRNIIQSGNLDVELYYALSAEDVENDNWSLVTKDTDAFGYDNWEPGFTKVVYFKVANKGSLALKYQLTADVYNEIKGINKDGEEFALSDYIKTAVVDTDDTRESILALSGTPLKGAYPVGSGNLTAKNDSVTTDEAIFGLAIWMPTIVGNEANHNGVKVPSIEFGINLVATQYTAENDSFGFDYDADASYPMFQTKPAKGGESLTVGEVNVELPAGADDATYTLKVDNKAVNTDADGDTTVAFDINLLKDGVKVAAEAGVKYPVSIYVGQNLNVTEVTHKGEAVEPFSYDKVTGIVSFETDSFSPFEVKYFEAEVKSAEDFVAIVNKGGDVVLADNVTLSEPLVIAEGQDIVIDLNSKEIIGTMHKSVGHVINNKGTMTIIGGTISSTANNGGSAIMNSGTVIIKNATLNGAPNADGSWPGYTINNTGVMTLENCTITSYHGAVASYNEGAVATMNNSNINMVGIKGFTNHGIYTYSGGKVIVNSGNIANHAADQGSTGGSVINGNVEVNGGTFTGRIENYYGTPVIKGGTFTVDPSRFVSGFQVVPNTNGTWTVRPYAVDNAEDIQGQLNNGNSVLLDKDVKTEASTTAPYGNKVGIIQKAGTVIDGNGNKLDIDCYGDDYGIMTEGGTIKNITIQEGCRAVMIMYPKTDVILDNVKIGGDGVLYPINTGEGGAEGVKLIVTNSTLAGWTSYGLIESASFTNVKFEQGTYYNNIYGRVLKPYVNTTLTNCEFVNHMNLDLSSLNAGHKITISNCKVNGVAVTADVFTVPTNDAQYDTELFTVDLPSWASSINDCIIFK